MNVNPKLHLQTPVGRFVGGSLTSPSMVDMHGKPRAKPQYFFMVAVRKDDPGIPELFTKTYHHAFAGYAQYPHIQDRMLTPRNPADPNAQRYLAIGWKGLQFAWKIDDGDAPRPDPSNPTAPPMPNPLTVGHWVFKFSSIFEPRVVNGQNQALNPADIKLGSFVDMAYNIEINGKTDHTAGLYMNPTFMRWLAYGQEIVKGPQPDQVFKGGVPTALPPGASHTPIAPAGAPGGPSAPMAPAHAPGMPPAAGGHLQPAPGYVPHAPGLAPGAGGYPSNPAGHATPPSLAPYNPAAGANVPGVMGNGANHAPAMPGTSSPPMNSETSSAYAAVAAPHGQYEPGNGYPAPGPAVPAAPDPANGAGSIPAGSSPVNASPSSPAYSPHPDFVSGGPQAA